jgi:hypothetical protein
MFNSIKKFFRRNESIEVERCSGCGKILLRCTCDDNGLDK